MSTDKEILEKAQDYDSMVKTAGWKRLIEFLQGKMEDVVKGLIWTDFKDLSEVLHLQKQWQAYASVLNEVQRVRIQRDKIKREAEEKENARQRGK